MVNRAAADTPLDTPLSALSEAEIGHIVKKRCGPVDMRGITVQDLEELLRNQVPTEERRHSQLEMTQEEMDLVRDFGTKTFPDHRELASLFTPSELWTKYHYDLLFGRCGVAFLKAAEACVSGKNGSAASDTDKAVAKLLAVNAVERFKTCGDRLRGIHRMSKGSIVRLREIQ